MLLRNTVYNQPSSFFSLQMNTSHSKDLVLSRSFTLIPSFAASSLHSGLSSLYVPLSWSLWNHLHKWLPSIKQQSAPLCFHPYFCVVSGPTHSTWWFFSVRPRLISHLYSAQSLFKNTSESQLLPASDSLIVILLLVHLLPQIQLQLLQ